VKEIIYIWNFRNYSTLASAILDWFGPNQCAVLRSEDINVSQSFTAPGIESETKVDKGFTLIKMSTRESLATVLGFDEWNIDMFVLPDSVISAEVSELVRRNAYDDSRGLGIESMRPDGMERISKWPYTIWLSFGAVDAKRRCLIRCQDSLVSEPTLRKIRESGRFLGIRNGVIAAQLADGEMVQCDEIPENP
jgi:hypothetical protein